MSPNSAGAPNDGPTAYHRLPTLRPAWSAWPKPLLTLLAAVVSYIVMASALLVIVVLVLALVPGVNIALGVTSGDPSSPLDVGLALAMGALWFPVGMIGVRVGGWRPVGTALSVAARFRWAMLREPVAAVLSVGGVLVVAASALAGTLTASPAVAGSHAAADPASASALLTLVPVVLLLVPLQVAGLELVLRGLMLQALGAWMRRPVLPILAAAGVMLIGRDLSPAVLIPALTLALCCGVLAWKSGGLELPMMLTLTVSLGAILTAAFGAGTGLGSGVASLVAATAAPGTSPAALADGLQGGAALTGGSALAGEPVLTGGIAGAAVLLLVTAASCALVSRQHGIGLLQPFTRAASLPLPPTIAI